jgi:hypothetical protein
MPFCFSRAKRRSLLRIRHYIQHRHANEAMHTKLEHITPTGDTDLDSRKSTSRLAVRIAGTRDALLLLAGETTLLVAVETGELEKQKGIPRSGDPDGKPAGTQRKCANCGQVGHIKTKDRCVSRQRKSESSSQNRRTHGESRIRDTILGLHTLNRPPLYLSTPNSIPLIRRFSVPNLLSDTRFPAHQKSAKKKRIEFTEPAHSWRKPNP